MCRISLCGAPRRRRGGMMSRSYVRRSQTKINRAVCSHLSMSSLSQSLDRDPSQSMHAQREGEFTSMMQIVLNEMPDHPLACIELIFSILIGIVNKFCQIGNGPVVQGILNDVPGGFQSIDQFGSGTGRLTRQRDQVFIALFQGIIQPASTHPDDMGGELANRTELRCATQGQLIE